MITNFTKPSTIQIISNWVEKKGKKNTFIRIISRSSVPAFASHASPCWLLLYPRRKEQIHIFSRSKAIQIEIKKKKIEREREWHTWCEASAREVWWVHESEVGRRLYEAWGKRRRLQHSPPPWPSADTPTCSFSAFLLAQHRSKA